NIACGRIGAGSGIGDRGYTIKERTMGHACRSTLLHLLWRQFLNVAVAMTAGRPLGGSVAEVFVHQIHHITAQANPRMKSAASASRPENVKPTSGNGIHAE